MVGGFAINRLGFVRATEDIDLLIARDLANQTLVKRALEILPDRAIRELGDEDIAQWVVVRVNDDITIDLMETENGRRTGSATVFQASLKFGFFRRWLRRTMSLRMRAMRASFLALPSATRRS